MTAERRHPPGPLGHHYRIAKSAPLVQQLLDTTTKRARYGILLRDYLTAGDKKARKGYLRWRGLQAGVLRNDIVHALNAIDVAGVIAEEDTTKGSKSAHEIGLVGDGRLNTICVARGGEHDLRHDEDLTRNKITIRREPTELLSRGEWKNGCQYPRA